MPRRFQRVWNALCETDPLRDIFFLTLSLPSSNHLIHLSIIGRIIFVGNASIEFNLKKISEIMLYTMKTFHVIFQSIKNSSWLLDVWNMCYTKKKFTRKLCIFTIPLQEKWKFLNTKYKIQNYVLCYGHRDFIVGKNRVILTIHLLDYLHYTYIIFLPKLISKCRNSAIDK